jgi:hypothetical protein
MDLHTSRMHITVVFGSSVGGGGYGGGNFVYFNSIFKFLTSLLVLKLTSVSKHLLSNTSFCSEKKDTLITNYLQIMDK